MADKPNTMPAAVRELRPHIPKTLAFRVRLYETPRNWVDYDGR